VPKQTNRQQTHAFRKAHLNHAMHYTKQTCEEPFKANV
jgi:hypothetical protein